MLSISKPQTNLIYLSILVGRLDLTRFSIKTSIGSGILLTEICLLIRRNLFISHRSCQPISKFYFASLYSVFRQPHIRASKWHCLTASLPVVVETYKIRVNALHRSSRTALVTPPGVEPGFPP